MSKQILIIGGGPAGIAAAIQLKRYGFSPVIIEKNELGGTLLNANLIDNYPGFPNGIKGKDLVGKFIEHIENLKIEVIKDNILSLNYDADSKEFQLIGDNKKYFSDELIIASGTKPKRIPLISNSISRDRILYEIQDNLHIQNKRIAIIGAGDIAFDYALSLSKKNEILIFNRSEEIKALYTLKKYILENASIIYFENSKVSKVSDTKKGDLALEVQIKNSLKIYEVNYLVIAAGRIPQEIKTSNLLKNQKEKLIKNGKLHIVGDHNNGLYRQASIAVADGIRAAMKIHFLNE